jgi:septum formation protein
MRLVLASASPRRADLLRAAGYRFEIDPAETDESVRPGESPADYALRVAREKAARVSQRHPDAFVLGADTIVVLDGEILGKPIDAADATRMLRLLSARTHEVLTGIALRRGALEGSHVEVSRVHFARLSPEEIRWYVESGEPADKAGAYAVQGLAGRFVERIEGSCANVIGLPVARVYRLLRELGFSEAPSRPGDD